MHQIQVLQRLIQLVLKFSFPLKVALVYKILLLQEFRDCARVFTTHIWTYLFPCRALNMYSDNSEGQKL